MEAMNLRLTTPFLPLGLAAFLLLSGCSGEKVENSVLLSKAVELGAKGDWAEAKRLAQKAARQEPNDDSALTMLAIALEQAGEQDAALEEATKAAKLSDKNFMAHFTKGRILYLKGRFDSCIGPLKTARALRPDSLDVVVLLAQASAIQNLPDAAGYYSILAKSDRFKSKPEPWNEIGMIFAVRGDYRRAQQYFAKAESLAPENPTVILNMAIVNEIHLKRPSEAATYYKKYLRLTARNPELEPKRRDVAERLKSLSSGD